MKTVATILVVLVALAGMAMPVLGATAGTYAGAYADWDIATQFTGAWAETYDGDEYVETGSAGESEGYTASDSGASADDDDETAIGGTEGYCESYDDCDTSSYVYAQENDEDGYTQTFAVSTATGEEVEVGDYAESFWGPPIWSESGAYGDVEDGWAGSGAWGIAQEP